MAVGAESDGVIEAADDADRRVVGEGVDGANYGLSFGKNGGSNSLLSRKGSQCNRNQSGCCATTRRTF